MSEKNNKKNFFLTGILGTFTLLWVLRMVLAGIIQATASFFTKEKWEKWKNRKKTNIDQKK